MAMQRMTGVCWLLFYFDVYSRTSLSEVKTTSGIPVYMKSMSQSALRSPQLQMISRSHEGHYSNSFVISFSIYSLNYQQTSSSSFVVSRASQ